MHRIPYKQGSLCVLAVLWKIAAVLRLCAITGSLLFLQIGGSSSGVLVGGIPLFWVHIRCPCWEPPFPPQLLRCPGPGLESFGLWTALDEASRLLAVQAPPFSRAARAEF